MSKPQDAAAVFGDLDRHAFADPAETIELVMRELSKIPNRRVCHLSTPLGHQGEKGCRKVIKFTPSSTIISAAAKSRPSYDALESNAE
jgi:hypothetical protein